MNLRTAAGLLGGAAAAAALAACGAGPVEQAAPQGPVAEPTSRPDIVNIEPVNGVDPLEDSAPIALPADNTNAAGEIPLPTATAEAVATVPTDASELAVLLGIDISTLTDNQKQAFYNAGRYLFVDTVTNVDGTTGTRFLPGSNISAAPLQDGIVFFGPDMTNDPLLGNGAEYAIIGTIDSSDLLHVSVRGAFEKTGTTIPEDIGNYSLVVSSSEDITVYYPDQVTVFSQVVNDEWRLSPRLAPTIPAATPTSAPFTPTAEVPTPIPAPAATQPSGGEVLNAGFSTFEFQTADGTIINAPVPAEFMNVLSGASAETTKVRGAERADLKIVGDIAYLGDMPLFFKSGGAWTVNTSVRYVPFYIEGPALVLRTGTASNASAAEQLDPQGIHSIQVDVTGGSKTVSVYPARFTRIDVDLAAIKARSGEIVQTSRAEAGIVYINTSGEVVESIVHIYEKSLTINNAESVPLVGSAETFGLTSLVNDPVMLTMFAEFPNPDPSNLGYTLAGVPLSAGTASNLISALEAGGDTLIPNSVQNVHVYR